MDPAHEPVAVWAPRARTVDLVAPGSEAAGPMLRGEGGWWRSARGLPSGTDYAFRLDGGEPRPDPRGPWQPHGVHAASRTFDAQAHVWQDESWAGRDARGALTYELHIGTFTPLGTLDAAIERLDHLLDLGVEMVELMPLSAFNGAHGWGYDGVALYAVHEPYGGPAALQRFVDAAHGRGLGVCLDVVYNHLGPSGNYLAEFGPYLTSEHQTPWGAAVNLDGPESPEVRAFLTGNALRWFRDFHLDALRLDAVHALHDTSPRHVLAELSDAVADLASQAGRPLSLVAESDLNDAVMVTPTGEGGLGMTAQWDDDVHHAVHALLTGERQGYYVDFGAVSTLASVLTDVFVHNGTFSTFRGRDRGTPVPDSISGHAFVVCTANHDQVGNRASGDRPAASLSPARLAQSAALVLGSPYTPMLFMGEEWGARTPFLFFTDHPEPELAAAVTRGRREEFGDHDWDGDVPDPQDPATFRRSTLDWSESADEQSPHQHARLLRWHRALAALRRAEPALASGDRRLTAVKTAPDGSWLVLRRSAAAGVGGVAGDDGGVAVVLALGDHRSVTVPLPGAAEILLAWDPSTRVGDGAVHVPADGVALVRLR